jgi:hypothetical protein
VDAGDGAGAIVGAEAAGGGVAGTDEADSSCLPQALKARTAASDAARIKGGRVIFMGRISCVELGSGSGRGGNLQLLAGRDPIRISELIAMRIGEMRLSCSPCP